MTHEMLETICTSVIIIVLIIMFFKIDFSSIYLFFTLGD